jgi:predicted alpha/beta-fold hydrolase
MPDTFQPMPLIRSGHHQTIAGYYVRQWQRALPGTQHKVPLPDGDALHVYETIPDTWKAEDPIVLIIHGLGGSHTSGSVTRLGWECLRAGLAILRINLRGSGDSLADNRLPYHAGCSPDILQVLNWLTHRHPGSPFYLVGFSLGGNIALKLAGETPQEDCLPLRHIVAVSPPAHLERSASMLAEPRNALYEKRFVAELKTLAEQRARQHGETPPTFPKKLKLREFDDLYTAPRVGYRDVADYYARASSLPFLHQVEIPTHILSAEDDPMIDPATIREAIRSPSVSIHLTPHGGHLGFLSTPRHGGWCWMEKYIVRMLTQQE